MSGGPDPLIVAARCCVLLLGVGLFGGACFSIYAPPGLRWPGGLAARVGTPALAALAALTWIGLLTREMSGGGFPDADLMVRLCAETGFGRALAVAVLAGLLLAVLSLVAARRRWARLVLSAVLLASVAMVGHAAASVGVSGVLREGVMVVHLLATAAWLGGLPPLAAALRRDHPAAPVLIETFGRIAFVAVLVLLGTGLVSIVYVLIASGGALGPAYLRTLAVKLAVVVGLLTIAAVNRLWLTPMLSRNAPRAIARLRASLLLEQVVAVGLVTVVALLGQLDPLM